MFIYIHISTTNPQQQFEIPVPDNLELLNPSPAATGAPLAYYALHQLYMSKGFLGVARITNRAGGTGLWLSALGMASGKIFSATYQGA